MNHNNKKQNNENNYSAGLVLIIVGILIFLWQLGFRLPSFLFHWYMIPIAVGIFVGAKNSFGEPYGWVIPIIIGGVFWANDVFPFYNLFKFIVPIILIGLGLMTLLKGERNKRIKQNSTNNDYIPFTETGNTTASAKQTSEYTPPITPSANTSESTSSIFENANTRASAFEEKKTLETPRATVAPSEDFFTAMSIFSGVKRNINSTQFKGGDITVIIGGLDINLLHSDFTGVATIHISQIMGGSSLKVPSSWTVRNEITSILGGVDDSRNILGPQSIDSSKVLILKGFNLMGGVEIKSY